MPIRSVSRDTGGVRRRSVLAAGLLALGCGAAAADAQIRTWSAGSAAPDWQLEGLDAAPWSSRGQAGRPTLLHFWATWCEACREEMPSLQAWARERAGPGVQVLAVNFKEGERAIRRFVAEHALELPIGLDRDGSVARAFAVRAFPSTVLLDAQGRPQATVVGALDWGRERASELLAGLLASAPR